MTSIVDKIHLNVKRVLRIRGSSLMQILVKIKSQWCAVKYFFRRQRIITMILGPTFERSTQRIEIDITYKCNLKCPCCDRSCTQAQTDVEMMVDQVRRFVDESISTGARWKVIRILGGEPTLHARLLDVIDILLDYKREYLPDVVIQLVTNGSGDVVKEVLKKIPQVVSVENSNKSVEGVKHLAFNNAPADHYHSIFFDYSNACDISHLCGMGFTPYGYYCCAVAGSIDRIFGFNIGRKTLPLKNDLMLDQLRVFCRLCGHFYGWKNRFDGTKISPAWKKAYAQYGVKKPDLTLY